MNLRRICINAAKKALKEAERPDASDVKAIKKTIKKYAPDWGELLGLNKEDMIDEIAITYLNNYFIVILFALDLTARDFEEHLKTEQAA